MRWVEMPGCPSMRVNLDEVVASLRDPKRLEAADDQRNRELAADMLENRFMEDLKGRSK